jgi:hypothetical protein
MASSKDEIRDWLKHGKQVGATHMLVVCDTFDHDDYPVYVMAHEKVREKAAKYNGENMQRLMEVYSLTMDLEKQLGEHRAFHYEDTP